MIYDDSPVGNMVNGGEDANLRTDVLPVGIGKFVINMSPHRMSRIASNHITLFACNISLTFYCVQILCVCCLQTLNIQLVLKSAHVFFMFVL